MVAVSKYESTIIFEVIGLHKLWALKSRLTIPTEHISKAYKGNKDDKKVFGLRLPGTHIPGLITAGTYITKQGKIFCDFTTNNNIIVIELQNEQYKRIIIEVRNVDAALALLPTGMSSYH